jgi:hypothetical protein
MTDVRLVASTTPGHKLVTALRFAIGSSSFRPAMHVQAFGPPEDAMTDIRLVAAHPQPGPDCTLNRALIDQMTDVRLAASTHPNHMHHRALSAEEAPVTDVRLVATQRQGTGKLDRAMPPAEEPPVTDVRMVGAAWDGANEQISTGIPAGRLRERPALLISYYYWKGFAKYRARYAFRDFALDSGAYSAMTGGTTIDLAAYIAFCQERLATDPECTEAMWKAGVPAIPVYHYRGAEPESVLKHYAAASPKLALGGMSDLRGAEQRKFAEQCFARVWPARIHGLACASETMLMALPWHSVDATNWILGPAGFGTYKSMGKPERAPRGKAINLRAEVEWWLALERRVKARWSRELAQLERDLPAWPVRARAAA